MSEIQVWDLWYPQAGSQGISFARGMTAPTDVMLVHAAPPVLRVEVREGDTVVARGDDLRGEVGVLTSWWNDESRGEWRWTLELHNHR